MGVAHFKTRAPGCTHIQLFRTSVHKKADKSRRAVTALGIPDMVFTSSTRHGFPCSCTDRHRTSVNKSVRGSGKIQSNTNARFCQQYGKQVRSSGNKKLQKGTFSPAASQVVDVRFVFMVTCNE